jgi:hypothetical protein
MSCAFPSSSRKSMRSCSVERAPGPQQNVRERVHGLREVGVAPRLGGSLRGSEEMLLGLLGVAEQEVDAAEVVEDPGGGEHLAVLAVQLERTLGVEARDEPFLPPFRDERRLEERVRLRGLVARARRELEGPFGVARRCVPVPPELMAARPPFVDVGGEHGARLRRLLVQVEGAGEE